MNKNSIPAIRSGQGKHIQNVPTISYITAKLAELEAKAKWIEMNIKLQQKYNHKTP